MKTKLSLSSSRARLELLPTDGPRDSRSFNPNRRTRFSSRRTLSHSGLVQDLVPKNTQRRLYRLPACEDRRATGLFATNRGVKLLIADDSPAMRAFLRQLCIGVATEVRDCADGAEAITAFDEFQPDWTLMDIAMPVMDGLAATTRITRAHP